jgi:formylglycine-generating enzyme required for sulfatase activity
MNGYVVLEGVSWRNPDLKGRPNAKDPVVQVSWVDAQAYCDWAGLALPTEEEWEKAASWDPQEKRARRYPWGDERPSSNTPAFANLADASFYKKFDRLVRGPVYDDGCAERAPVGSFPLDRSPCGAFDMGGNVSEWCRDGGEVGQLAIETRRYRGGNWCADKSWAQSGSQLEATPKDTSATWVGFRPVLELR